MAVIIHREINHPKPIPKSSPIFDIKNWLGSLRWSLGFLRADKRQEHQAGVSGSDFRKSGGRHQRWNLQTSLSIMCEPIIPEVICRKTGFVGGLKSAINRRPPGLSTRRNSANPARFKSSGRWWMASRLMTTSKLASGKASFSIRPTSNATSSRARAPSLWPPRSSRAPRRPRQLLPSGRPRPSPSASGFPTRRPRRAPIPGSIPASSTTIRLFGPFIPNPAKPVKKSYRDAQWMVMPAVSGPVSTAVLFR